jgi:hypothetical protein
LIHRFCPPKIKILVFLGGGKLNNQNSLKALKIRRLRL